MKLGYTIIYVPDVPATVAFNEAAFGLTTKFIHDSNLYGEMNTGETTLAKPWGQTVSYLRDLNGCLVEIASPVGS